MQKHKVTAGLLTVMLAMGTPVTSFAASFSDMPNNWAKGALERAVQEGLLAGIDGQIKAEGKVTRAQLAAIIARAFGAEATAPLTQFSDVPQDAWYASDIAKAVRMGALSGRSASYMAAEEPVTREELFSVMARLLALPAEDESVLNGYADGASVSPWARGAMATMVHAGYVQGSNDRLDPQGYTTRAELAALFDKMFAAYAPTDQDVIKGNVLLKDATSLKGKTIEGDLILGDGVEKDAVDLENVTIKGRLLVRGGHTVTLKGVDVPNIIVQNRYETTTIHADKVASLDARTNTILASGEYQTVYKNATVTANDGVKVENWVEKTTPSTEEKKDDGPINTVKPGTVPLNLGGTSGFHTKKKKDVRYGDANVDQQYYPLGTGVHFMHPPFYNERVAVEVDKEGRIVSVTDDDSYTKGLQNESQHDFLVRKHGPYLELLKEANVHQKFVGKTLEEVKAMKMENGQADAITGATLSGLAVKQAVINAIEGKKGKGFLNEATENLNGGTGEPVEAIESAGTFKATLPNSLPEGFVIDPAKVQIAYGNKAGMAFAGKDASTFTPLAGGYKVSFGANGKDLDITFEQGAKPGAYFVIVKDESGTYRSPSFDGHNFPVVVIPAGEDNGVGLSADGKLEAKGTSNIADIVKNIEHFNIFDESKRGTKVNRKGKEVDYSGQTLEAIGHHGNLSDMLDKVVAEDGTINNPKDNKGKKIFEDGKIYTITVETYGYGTVVFSIRDGKVVEVKTAEGDANVDQQFYPLGTGIHFMHPPFYNERVAVSYIEENGEKRILSVKDNDSYTKGLQDPSQHDFLMRKHGPYLDTLKREKVHDKFVGKTLEEVKTMQMENGQADAITTATLSGLAVKQAVINALEGKKGKGFLNEKTEHLNGGNGALITAQVSGGTYKATLPNALPEGFEINPDNITLGYGNTNGMEIIGKDQQGKEISRFTPVDKSAYQAALASNGKDIEITFTGTPKAGAYFVNVVDESGSYRSPSIDGGNFPIVVVEAAKTVTIDNNLLLAIEDADIADVVKNIEHLNIFDESKRGTKVKTKRGEAEYSGRTFEALGHHGNVNEKFAELITADGQIQKGEIKLGEETLDLENKEYTITVETYGYGTATIKVGTPKKEEPAKPAKPTQDQKVTVEKEVHGDSNFHSWNAVLDVVITPEGTIKSVTDNSQPGTNAPYWGAMLGAFGKPGFLTNSGVNALNYINKNSEYYTEAFKGKDKAYFEGLQANTGEVDAITGATHSGVTLKEAMLEAFEKWEAGEGVNA